MKIEPEGWECFNESVLSGGVPYFILWGVKYNHRPVIAFLEFTRKEYYQLRIEVGGVRKITTHYSERSLLEEFNRIRAAARLGLYDKRT